jgi:hypothetical protein
MQVLAGANCGMLLASSAIRWVFVETLAEL